MNTLRSQHLFTPHSCSDSIFFGLCRQYLPTSVEDPIGANSNCQNCSSRCQTCDGQADNQCTSCVHGLALSHGKLLFYYLPKGHEIMTTMSVQCENLPMMFEIPLKQLFDMIKSSIVTE